ncbi:MAG: DUF4804 domain-containing protein [Bacteroidota bacterium]
MKVFPLSYQQLCERSAQQAYPFPLQSNRISEITGPPLHYAPQQIEQHAANVRLLIHPRTRQLAQAFLQAARLSGTSVERSYYQQIEIDDFLRKLIVKRPLMFMTESDAYILRDGQQRGDGGFEMIGTTQEKSPLLLAEYNSYREMQLAALLGVSVPTYFINEGDRFNKGEIGQKGSFEEQGIYSGLVGARFERPELMEWQHMIITETQNTAANGYGPDAKDADWALPIWAEFYDSRFAERFSFPDYATASQDQSGRYIEFPNESMFGKAHYFDTTVYKARMRRVVEPFLRDANERAKQANKQAYVVAVGLGIGVWAIKSIKDIQAQLQVESYLDTLAANDFSHISDLRFSWFPESTHRLAAQFPAGIKLAFDKQSPMVKLQGADEGKLLVANYAWDGNSYPGNEYWQGSLAASGDPAAMCCSTLGELQNPDVNPFI